MHRIIQVQQFQSIVIDWRGPLSFNDDNTVIIDASQMPLSTQDYEELCIKVNPLEPSSEYGTVIFRDCTVRHQQSDGFY